MQKGRKDRNIIVCRTTTRNNSAVDCTGGGGVTPKQNTNQIQKAVVHTQNSSNLGDLEV